MSSKTVDYNATLYGQIMDNMADYHQTGETVCGAQDPAVITLREPVDGFTVVRVVDRYRNANASDTLLVFSNVEITEEEYADYDKLMDEYGA